MDRYFINLMLDQIQKGNQIDGVFSKHAWEEIIASFNSKFNFNYDMDVLKNRYKTLIRQYNVIKNLLDLDGFTWDDTRRMVTADDHVWQDYIKTHTDARQFMTRPIPYYKDLCAICGDCSVEERDCLSGLNLGQIQEGKFQETMQSSQSTAASESNDDQLDGVPEVIRSVVSDQKKRRQLENLLCSPQLKKAKGKNDGIATALQEMVSAVGSLSEKKEDNKSNSALMEKVVEAVQALPDIDEELLDACDFLEDEKKAKTFLALDVKLRKKWLMRKIRPQMHGL